MTLRFAGRDNGYLPEFTGQVIAYIRKESEFPLNRYVQYVPTPKPQGIYTRIDRDNAVRIKDTDRFSWMDGANAPSMDVIAPRFETVAFATRRRAIPWFIGFQAVEHATFWKPKLVHTAEAISMMMTLRTQDVVTLLETSGNYGGNTDTATNLGGGKWDVGTSTNPYFKRGLLAAVQAVNRSTNGKVKPKDLRLILNPEDAADIGSSAEITDYLKSSVYARPHLEDPFDAVNEQWGLPRQYQGVEIVVEDSMKVTESYSAAGTEATSNRSRIKTSGTAALVSRPQGLDGEYGAPSFSTASVFYHKDLIATKMDSDSWNEQYKGLVYEDIFPAMTSGISGYYITAINN